MKYHSKGFPVGRKDGRWCPAISNYWAFPEECAECIGFCNFSGAVKLLKILFGKKRMRKND